MKITICISLILILLSLNATRRVRSLYSENDLLNFLATMADLSIKSYSPDELLEGEWKKEGTVYVESLNAFALIVTSASKKQIVVAIRGTEKWTLNQANLVTDFKMCHVSYPMCSDCFVHKGFSLQLAAMTPLIDKKLKPLIDKYPSYDILLIGHSLGGAIATLYANYMKKTKSDLKDGKIKLITFGSPRVGNKNFADWTNQLLGANNIFRVVYKNDPVPLLPAYSLGYYHVGTKSYRFSDINKFDVHNKPDEKNSFANYVTSFSDHTVYNTIKPQRLYRRLIRRYMRRRRIR